MLLTATHAAESGHWYKADGSAAYEIIAKNGEPRPTTLRDARKLNLYPSVTTITRMAASPGLELWKQQQVLLAALTLPKINLESEDAYLARILADSREQAKKAMEKGTAIHAAIQGQYEGRRASDDMLAHVVGACDAVKAAYGVNLWTAERSFADPQGYGGKVDLSCDGFVIDFKTKEFGPDKLPKGWDEQAMQLAAYRVGLGMPLAGCANVFVSTTQPGLAHVFEWSQQDLAKGWECFKALLAYHQAKTGYRPQP